MGSSRVNEDRVVSVDEKALFSPDPYTRWEEARLWAQSRGWTKGRNAQLRVQIMGYNLENIEESDIDSVADLPPRLRVQVVGWGEEFALCGSLNAWMAFIGPSPGGSPSHSKRMHDLLDSSEHVRNPVLGRPHPTLWYVDGAGFFDEVRQWVCGAYESAGYFRKTKDEFGALASFLMLNLVKEAYGPERRVPGELLAQGATRFWRGVMPIVRPKLVVALTRGVYGVLLSAARGQGLRVDELPETRVESGNKVYQLPKARIRSGGRGNVLVVTVLTHPSWLKSWIDQRKLQSRLYLTAYLGACVEEALRV